MCVSARLCPNLSLASFCISNSQGRKSSSLQTASSVIILLYTLSIPFMDSFLFISLSDPHSYNPHLSAHYPSLDLQQRYGVCAVRIREAENKSSVRYEVIVGIISIINQRFSRGAEGRGGKEEGEG